MMWLLEVRVVVVVVVGLLSKLSAEMNDSFVEDINVV
jgi:hypothetical protein